MIRQTVRSLALAALAFALAGGAWGQALRQGSSDAAMVALEYFGATIWTLLRERPCGPTSP